MNTKAKSYNVFTKKYNSEIGFKFSLHNIAINEVGKTRTYSLPLELAYEMEKYLKITYKL